MKKKLIASEKPGRIRRPRGTKVVSPEVLPAEPSENTDEDSAEDYSKEASEEAFEDASEEPSEADIHAEMGATEDRTQSEDHQDSANSKLPISSGAEAESTAVSPQDPLRRYLEEIRKYPFLESQEEFALANRLRETGDIDAAKALVTANLRLVVKIAFEYRNFYSNILDLVQEGNIGLMKAVSKYEPTKGARLGYYASWWIRSYILKYLLDNFRLVKVGTTQAQKKLFYHLMREKEKLEAQGFLAGPKLLAEKLNVREKDVIEMEQRLSGRGAEMSLDTPVNSGDSTTTHMELLADHSESADNALERNQLLQLLHDKLPGFQKILNEKELRILKDRLLAEEPKTLQEVADLYGLTRERARQIEAKVIEKLRIFLKPEI